MTATAETLALAAPDTEPNPQVGVPPPVLITVQEVAFSTAAAMPVRPTTRRPSAGGLSVVVTAMRRMLAASTPDVRASRGDYPKRYSFLENACMSREMDRL
ncbi:hypothetical protein A5791_13090 [Mycobacterium sp. 852002-51163_SCH5372311]|uniref:hypothetical protein n=1 Tax=Mycobacterium sp. 852002-51163_SCH5372311 TaxID=1834097 RepID=UPI000800C002|nr:hypothetical protein [Mycobacterium sp. 852002-51163_SCH5372311]OBF93000.1 hypothetical protein A5791_13090 [Mycobacterium sp. 852002-51163_SCH5372311]